MKAYIYYFVKGLESMPKYQGTLWRGIRGEFAGAVGDKFSLDDIIHFNAYSSASPSRIVAKRFIDDAGLLFKYVGITHSARDVRAVSAYPSEDERMILAGSTFIVKKEVHRAEDGILEIHLKEGQFKHA